MRAIIVRNKEFIFSEVSEPIMKDNLVKVRVTAFGLNGTDLVQRSFKSFNGTIPGVEFSGHVVEVGKITLKNLPVFEVGDRVCGFVYTGASAEYVVCDPRHLIIPPTSVSSVAAAAMPFSWLSAIDALSEVGGFKQRDKVLIHLSKYTAFGVSMAQYAQSIGCRRIIVLTQSEEQSTFVRENLKLTGALPDELVAINAKKEDWVSIVRKIDPNGVQIIINEGREQLEKDCKVLAPGGALVYVGLRDDAVSNKTTSLNGIRVQATNLRNKNPKYIAGLCRLYQERFVDHFANSKLRVHLYRAFDWEKMELATGVLETQLGKIVCTVNSPGHERVRLGI